MNTKVVPSAPPSSPSKVEVHADKYAGGASSEEEEEVSLLDDDSGSDFEA